MEEETDVVSGLKEVRDDILDEDVRRDDATTVLIIMTDGKDNENSKSEIRVQLSSLSRMQSSLSSLVFSKSLAYLQEEIEKVKDEDVDHIIVIGIGSSTDQEQLLVPRLLSSFSYLPCRSWPMETPVPFTSTPIFLISER